MKKKRFKSKKTKYGSKRDKFAKHNRWVVKCLKAYEMLLKSPAGKKLELVSYPADIKMPHGVVCSLLTSANVTYPASVMLTVAGKRHLIVGDPANRSLAKLAPDKLACDQLVLGAPTSMKATYYFKGLKTLLAKIAPKEIVLCVDSARLSKSRKIAIDKCAEMCSKFNFRRTD